MYKIFACLVFAALSSPDVMAQTKSNAKNLVEIAPVIVKASQLSDDGEVDGYRAGESRSSTRTSTSLIDIPQAVSVVTGEQIQDQRINSMSEAMRYIPGVSVAQGEGNRDQVVIRGNNTTADFYIDGARDDSQYFRDFYNIDRIEVLKGPNALAFGRGGSGGLINRVSKTADGAPIYQLILSGGSYYNKRVQADLGNRINDKIAVRVNAMYEDSETFREHGDIGRHGFNPTAKIKLGKSTKLDVGYEYFSDNRFPDRGIPSMNGLPYPTDPATFFGNPDENVSDAKINSIYTTLTHDFSPKLQLRNLSRYIGSNKFYQNTYASSSVNPSTGMVSISAYNNSTDRDNYTNQTDLTKKFETGFLKHTGLVGMELTKENTSNIRNSGTFNNSSATSVLVAANNPITFAPINYSQLSGDTNNNTKVKVVGLYLQDQIDINKYLKLIGGVRYDNFEQDYYDNTSKISFNRTDNVVSPRAGFVVKPQDKLSFYGNYSVSFLPSSGDQFSSLDDQSKSMKPEKLTNYELGSKFDIAEKLNLSSAIYELYRTNSRAPNPDGSQTSVLTGETRIRGLELEAVGKITNNWQIIGGYTLQSAEVLSATSTAKAGSKVALVPKNVLSVWNRYDFNQYWAAAIGFISQSGQYAAADNSVWLKGYNRFDGAAYYNINKKYRLQLNVENIFNQNYIQTAHNNNNIQPGSPRSFIMMLITNF